MGDATSAGLLKLEAKLVGDIQGFFFVPSYQRGYRWGDAEVIRLLDDIYATEGKRNYCLQPVVVRKNGDRFELIDGQQRLTTLYLIYRYMNEASFGFIDEPRFSLSYGTREKTEEFLKSLDISRKEENIDFWFIASAYESINWFIIRAILDASSNSLLQSFLPLIHIFGNDFAPPKLSLM